MTVQRLRSGERMAFLQGAAKLPQSLSLGETLLTSKENSEDQLCNVCMFPLAKNEQGLDVSNGLFTETFHVRCYFKKGA